MFGWFTDRAAATKAHRWEELIPPGATQVDLHKRRLGPAGGTAVAEALRNNTTLTLLDLSTNHLGEEGGKAIAEALRHNTTLTALDLNANRLGEAGGKAMADALRHNTTLTLLNIGFFNSIPKLLLEEIKELVRTAPERRQRAEEEERRRKQEEVEREEQERIIEQRQREEQEKLRQQKEQQQQWQGERVGRTLAALRAVRLSRHSSFSDYTHAQQLLQQALDYVSTLDRTPGKAMAAALAAKEELEAVQKTIREGTAWPDEEILTRRDQARRKLVEAVRRAAAEWREQEAAAVQQRCMHWSQQLMEVLLKVGKDRTIRKVEDLKEKEKEKEKETEEAADELQSGTEALKKIREWQEIHAEQQQIMEAETESQAQKVSNAFHRGESGKRPTPQR